MLAMTEKKWTEFVNKYSAITPEEEVKDMKEATITSLILGLLTMLTMFVLIL